MQVQRIDALTLEEVAEEWTETFDGHVQPDNQFGVKLLAFK